MAWRGRRTCTPARARPRTIGSAFVEELRQEGIPLAGAKVGDPDPLAAVSDECNFNDYDELIVSTLPLKLSKWLSWTFRARRARPPACR